MDAITPRELRAILFDIDDQALTVGELRLMLFHTDEQDVAFAPAAMTRYINDQERATRLAPAQPSNTLPQSITLTIWDRQAAQPVERSISSARILATAPQVIGALRQLVGADNTNYQRDTMRYCGYFEAGRAALKAATGEDLSRPDGKLGFDPLAHAVVELVRACEGALEVLAAEEGSEFEEITGHTAFDATVEPVVRELRAAIAHARELEHEGE